MASGKRAVMRRPGFASGFRSVFDGLSALARRPALWVYAAVPALVLLALGTFSIFAALTWVRPFVIERLPEATSWYGRTGASLLGWLAALAAGFAGLLASVVLAPPLSGPALERLVAEVERELGVPARPELGFVREMVCGARALAAGLLFSVPVFVAFFAVELLLPPAVTVTAPLKFAIGALLLAWSLFDYPLTLRGIGVRERLGFLRSHIGTALGFGCAFALLFWLPCCGVVLLPVGVTAGTRLLYEILALSPDSLPDLPRPAAGG